MDLNSFVGESIRREGGEALRRARVVFAANVFALTFVTFITIIQATRGSTIIAAVCGAFVLAMLGSLIALRRFGAWRFAGAFSILAILICSGSVAFATGGALPAAGYYLGLASLITTLVFGAYWGAAPAAITILTLSGIEALRRQGFDFPLQISAEVAAASRFRGAMIFQIIVFVLSALHERLRVISHREAAESEARFHALSAGGTDLLFELDGEGRIVFVSREHGRSLGGKSEDAEGRPISHFVHPDDARAFAERLSGDADAGAGPGQAVRLRFGGEGWRWFEPGFTSYETPDGHGRTIVVARDMTERLAIERRLRQSQKMDAIGQLAGGVAHDFNNLLLVVTGYGEILARGSPDKRKAQHAAQEILRAAEHGERLTRQLRAVGLSAPTDPEPLDLNELVASLSSMLGKVAGELVSVDFVLGKDLAPVLADKGRIEQILVNLVINARDATAGRGNVIVETSTQPGTTTIRVIDDGSGMNEEVRERVFEAFFTTKDRQQGTGLGLYVVYSLVRGMGGDVRVASEVGTGTTVTIDLPARRDLRVMPPGEVSAQGREVPRGAEALLVVEDRDSVRTLILETLDAAGYDVVGASNGGEGLDALRSRQGRFDLVISDVVMPGMSGPEMARAIRLEWPETRFLFVSGHPEQADALARQISDSAILMKPFLSSELCRRVRTILDEAR